MADLVSSDKTVVEPRKGAFTTLPASYEGIGEAPRADDGQLGIGSGDSDSSSNELMTWDGAILD